MSFHSVVHVRHSTHHWQRKRLWFPVKGKRSNRLRCNSVEWYMRTLNNCRAGRSLVRLGGGEERWEAPDAPRGFFLKIGLEPS
ncbi:hypothetical protein TNCV_1475061 [Trichonephila clavipes]|nr:hypothetical protein TNCV_1475061 [Trichonephila clavipes]